MSKKKLSRSISRHIHATSMNVNESDMQYKLLFYDQIDGNFLRSDLLKSVHNFYSFYHFPSYKEIMIQIRSTLEKPTTINILNASKFQSILTCCCRCCSRDRCYSYCSYCCYCASCRCYCCCCCQNIHIKEKDIQIAVDIYIY